MNEHATEKTAHCREWREHGFHAERSFELQSIQPCSIWGAADSKRRTEAEAETKLFMAPNPSYCFFQLFGLVFLGIMLYEVWRNSPWQCFFTENILFFPFPLPLVVPKLPLTHFGISRNETKSYILSGVLKTELSSLIKYEREHLFAKWKPSLLNLLWTLVNLKPAWH